MLQPWQWFVGTLEFIAAWTATECFVIWRKHRPRAWKQPTDPAVHPADWPKRPTTIDIAYKQARHDALRRHGFAGGHLIDIPDDWRDTMKRKELLWREERW